MFAKCGLICERAVVDFRFWLGEGQLLLNRDVCIYSESGLRSVSFQVGFWAREPLSIGMLQQSLPRVKAMSNNRNVTDVDAAKFKVPTSKRKKTVKTTKLKSSKWYQSAVRSVGIVKARSPESRDDLFE